MGLQYTCMEDTAQGIDWEAATVKQVETNYVWRRTMKTSTSKGKKSCTSNLDCSRYTYKPSMASPYLHTLNIITPNSLFTSFKLSQFTSQKLFTKPNVSTADCCLLQWSGIQYVGVGLTNLPFRC